MLGYRKGLILVMFSEVLVSALVALFVFEGLVHSGDPLGGILLLVLL